MLSLQKPAPKWMFAYRLSTKPVASRKHYLPFRRKSRERGWKSADPSIVHRWNVLRKRRDYLESHSRSEEKSGWNYGKDRPAVPRMGISPQLWEFLPWTAWARSAA